MNRPLCAVLISFLCSLLSPASTHPDQAAVLGTWEGESKCTIATSPCHDEHVIYHIAADDRVAGRLSLDAYKVVAGQQEFMGTLGCQYRSREAMLSCSGNTVKKDDWEFKVSGDSMTGTLTIGDEKTLYRRISVRRK
ncbi:MAG: hypothetical protein LAO56_08870 [Acidobacteriia bacterium]|nr:hypothetical protein [Terriglobia bacterium]